MLRVQTPKGCVPFQKWIRCLSFSLPTSALRKQAGFGKKNTRINAHTHKRTHANARKHTHKRTHDTPAFACVLLINPFPFQYKFCWQVFAQQNEWCFSARKTIFPS